MNDDELNLNPQLQQEEETAVSQVPALQRVLVAGLHQSDHCPERVTIVECQQQQQQQQPPAYFYLLHF